MLTYRAPLANPLIHLETERNTRMNQNQLQDINEQFERTEATNHWHRKFLERRTYITFLLAAEEASLSDKWVFTV
jgi:hypothetical protein